MAKIQKRRCVSIKPLTYQRVKNYCRVRNRSISGLLEELIERALSSAGEPVPERIDLAPKERAQVVAQHFTW